MGHEHSRNEGIVYVDLVKILDKVAFFIFNISRMFGGSWSNGAVAYLAMRTSG